MLGATQGLGPSLAIAGIGLLVGWILLWRASVASRRGWIYRRAPRLPIDVLADHDDAWIEGVVRTDQPKTCPHFGFECASYLYHIEREVEDEDTDDDGNTTTSSRWETVHREQEVAPFDLVSDDGSIVVDLPSAKSVDYVTESDRHGDLRYRASYLPIDQSVTVLGVKRDGGDFGPLREIPLVVSRREHAALMRAAEKGEGRRRTIGLVVSAVALGIAVAVYARYQIPSQRLYTSLSGASFAIGVWLPLWAVSTFNRFVRQREQVQAAWRQIDVDLAVRNALLPNYQRVVAGYAAHERALQERLAELRTELQRPDVQDDVANHGRTHASEADAEMRIETDRMTSGTVRSLLAVVEDYPQLKADTLFADLHRRLWALEEKLAASRDFYNGCARQWNQLVQGFPSVLVAAFAGHRTRPYFEG